MLEKVKPKRAAQPRIKMVKIDGHVYHIARNWEICKAAAKEIWRGYSDFQNVHWHHVVGRAGILKHMVEAVCPMPIKIHKLEKALKPADRERVHDYARRAIFMRFGEEHYIRLCRIRNMELHHPKQLKVKEIEEKG